LAPDLYSCKVLKPLRSRGEERRGEERRGEERRGTLQL
jgi:hypothetical protein